PVWASLALSSSQHRLLRLRGSRHRRQGIPAAGSETALAGRPDDSSAPPAATASLEIPASNHTIIAADPLPAEHRTAVAPISQPTRWGTPFATVGVWQVNVAWEAPPLRPLLGPTRP